MENEKWKMAKEPVLFHLPFSIFHSPLPLFRRWFFKALFFFVFAVFVLNPNVKRAVMQARHTLHPESLIQTDFLGMKEIHYALDQMIAADREGRSEVQLVEKFVYDTIQYVSDYKNWGNIEYWPTAEEVWERKREDCDGRAILAVSIMRARGYRSAKLVVGLSHMWAQVDASEKFHLEEPNITALLSPERRVQVPLKAKTDGWHFVMLAKEFLKPSNLKSTMSGLIADIPVPRKAILFGALLLICGYPWQSWMGLAWTATMGLGSVLLLNAPGLGPVYLQTGIWVLGWTVMGAALIVAALGQKVWELRFLLRPVRIGSASKLREGEG